MSLQSQDFPAGTVAGASRKVFPVPVAVSLVSPSLPAFYLPFQPVYQPTVTKHNVL